MSWSGNKPAVFPHRDFYGARQRQAKPMRVRVECPRTTSALHHVNPFVGRKSSSVPRTPELRVFDALLLTRKGATVC